jgi:hypothetical protein
VGVAATPVRVCVDRVDSHVHWPLIIYRTWDITLSRQASRRVFVTRAPSCSAVLRWSGIGNWKTRKCTYIGVMRRVILLAVTLTDRDSQVTSRKSPVTSHQSQVTSHIIARSKIKARVDAHPRRRLSFRITVTITVTATASATVTPSRQLVDDLLTMTWWQSTADVAPRQVAGVEFVSGVGIQLPTDMPSGGDRAFVTANKRRNMGEIRYGTGSKTSKRDALEWLGGKWNSSPGPTERVTRNKRERVAREEISIPFVPHLPSLDTTPLHFQSST